MAAQIISLAEVRLSMLRQELETKKEAFKVLAEQNSQEVQMAGEISQYINKLNATISYFEEIKARELEA